MSQIIVIIANNVGRNREQALQNHSWLIQKKYNVHI